MAKSYLKKLERVDRNKKYSVDEALDLLSKMEQAKFDETVDIAIRLGVDPKQTDQNVRGAVGLPHGTGKKTRVAVFAKGDKADEALQAGADVAGGEDLVKKVEGGFFEFDKTVATPDMMPLVGKLGKVLGPRGLMPNPKLGTVTTDVAKAVKELKAGRVEFRIEKAAIIHSVVGKKSFSSKQLKENIEALLEAVTKAKPSQAKGNYLLSVTLSSTMGPGIKLDPAQFWTV